MTREEAENSARAIARNLLNEFRSKENTSTFRQLLDKYANQAKPLCPPRHEAWLWLCVIVHRVAEGK
jgi:hypothetical protein